MTLESGLWSLIGVFVTGLFAFLAQRVIAQSNVQKAKVEEKVAATQADSQRIQSLWERVDTLSERVTTLQSQVLELRADLGSEQSKNRAWRTHVLDWRSQHPDQSTWPRLPPLLQDELAT